MLSTKIFTRNHLKLKEDFVRLLKDYVEKEEFPKQIAGGILDMAFIDENPVYYTYYPYLFSEQFNIHDKQTLDLLSLAGFLYFKSIVNIDVIFDSQEAQSPFQNYILANICQEETVKLLSELFDSNHPFWKAWNKRKFEYVKAYQIDQESHNIRTYEEFETLADFKCAFGKIAIDSLFFLSGCQNKASYEKVLNSHKCFYAAFQILDDIADFKEDMENGQFNIVGFELRKQLTETEIKESTIRDLKTKLYLNGTIRKLQDQALSYIEQAEKSVDMLNAEQWKFEMQKMRNTIISDQLNLDGFIKVFDTKNNLSGVKRSSVSPNEQINSALKFIINAQNKDGSWNDHFNEAGVSDTWATAFILSAFPKEYYEVYRSHLDRASNFLLQAMSNNNLWGYNSRWVADADSTTFAMLSQLCLGNGVAENSLHQWLEFQNSDGGFRTYLNKEIILASLNNDAMNDVEGWLRSHFCVSATAYYYLCRAGIFNDHFFRLKDYLSDNLKHAEHHHSYWWTDFIYTLSFLIKGATLINDDEVLKLCNPILDRYVKTGLTGKSASNYFYMGVLLDCVFDSKIEKDEWKEPIQKLASTLLENQMEDGSWPGNYSLRIPHPGIKFPQDPSHRWMKSDRGTNIVVEDFHRLFTSVVCTASLVKHEGASSNVR
ncbi:squalene-hopene cyclase [Fulvivirga imtechensis AK7]|uniref:Squalene-hopene cyclase n=1 Tax=Fulvivirga imtechensis AK7 TaxID=1237149 RepID=L8JZW6_9BACT|nr:prenyltransferase/squalene oxidase repeat-containing protein [Fulvivirga imtechensis]ELR73693.1 squalene-hopene cyclase [Fulvivirga imtechensis AK7]